MKKIGLLAIFLLSLITSLSGAFAQKAEPSKENAPAASAKESGNFIYATPSFENFSKMYWAIGKLDTMNDEHVDNYMLINECDIYKDFHQNEFEWEQIRETARKYLKKNAVNFPLRFQLTQKINLGRYDTKKNRFEIVDTLKIDGIRRFDVLADNYTDSVCGFDTSGTGSRILPGYPKSLLIILNKPLIMNSISVSPEKAKKYVEEKMKHFKGFDARGQSEENVYAFRDAYIVMKVRLFAYKGEQRDENRRNQAMFMAFLEDVEVYADEKRTDLLYAADFKQKKKNEIGAREEDELFLPNPNPNKRKENAQPDTNKPQGPIKIVYPEYSPSAGEDY